VPLGAAPLAAGEQLPVLAGLKDPKTGEVRSLSVARRWPGRRR
jgi:hypothetical protein